MTVDPEGLDNAIRVLARLVLAEETLDATLSRVAGLACRDPRRLRYGQRHADQRRAPVHAGADRPGAGDLDTAQYRSEERAVPRGVQPPPVWCGAGFPTVPSTGRS